MENEIQKSGGNLSERFTNMVMSNYSNEIGKIQFDNFKKKLAQHLFIRVDMALKDAEARRNPAKSKTPITWPNVNLNKLAIDAVHRIELQLDALIPNHIHPIPYWNSKLSKYDIDLRIGYAGKDYYFREMALYPPNDIRVELVHANDRLCVLMKGAKNDIESYEFEIVKPFDRGPVVGGFGYISYDDARKNKLVLVYMDDFEKAKKAAGTEKFWGPYEDDMRRKTIIHRLCRYITLDPKKINKSFAVVEDQEYIQIHNGDDVAGEIEQEANTGEIIDIDTQGSGQEMTDEEKAEILAEEAAMSAADGGDGDPGNSTAGPGW